MSRKTLTAISMLLVPGSLVLADHLPGTLNFENVTGSRLNSTTGEQSNNEKEVDLGDFDEDNDLDVLVGVAFSDFGARRNKLYRNDGGTLVEISNDATFINLNANRVTRNAFLRDFDGDGHLDIWFVNDSNSHADQIFLAEWAEGGSFVKFTETAGRIPNGGMTGAACSAIAADLDGDTDIDVYCGNYPNTSQDRMYFNNGSAFFTDMTSSHVPSDGDYTVDISTADLNGDGKLDVLLANGFNDQNQIYYNNWDNNGSGPGDFKYSGSVQNLGTSSFENAMEPGDFDNDGDLDIYWSDRTAAGDRISRNNSVAANGHVNWSELNILPNYVNTTCESRKATVADLNNDGRVDVFVMCEDSRPAILRNTTVNNTISFIEWTPQNAFGLGGTFRGWHAAAFDSNNDGDLDIFIGGHSGDHLFENQASNEVTEDDGYTLPALFQLAPVAVEGSGGTGEIDTYEIPGNVTTGYISAVINGDDDYMIELIMNGSAVVATSDRGGLGVEEAFQYNTSGTNSYELRVTVIEGGGGGSHEADLDGDGQVGPGDLAIALGNWGDCKGCPADLNGDGVVNPADLAIILGNWGATGGGGGYILEVMARRN